MEQLIPILAVPLVIVIAIYGIVWRFNRSRSILDRWASGQGIEVLNAEYRVLRTGPFFFRHDENQTVYYVTIRDQVGNVRHAYLRCGGWFLGLLSDAVAVEWVD